MFRRFYIVDQFLEGYLLVTEGYTSNGRLKNFSWTPRNLIFAQLIPAPSSNLRFSHLDHTLETGEWDHGVGTVETNASIPRIFRRHATLHCAILLFFKHSSNPQNCTSLYCTLHYSSQSVQYTPCTKFECTQVNAQLPSES